MTARGATTAPPAPRWLPAGALPGCLSDVPHPPAGLWCWGDLGSLEGAPERLVAIVGTREASSYGIRTARKLATACARAGLVVVSGLARGVDAAAHEATLEAGGLTVAVLGTGVDVPYPAGHRTLLRDVVGQGLALSEADLGARARPGCFPRRNRLIAGLAMVVVVVEAGHKSGAINTASQALEMGRTVAAVPGPIDDPRSAGANTLIRDGAQVITGVEDLLSLYGLSTRSLAGPAPRGEVTSDAGSAGPQGPVSRHDAGGRVDESRIHRERADFGILSVRQFSASILDAELRG